MICESSSAIKSNLAFCVSSSESENNINIMSCFFHQQHKEKTADKRPARLQSAVSQREQTQENKTSAELYFESKREKNNRGRARGPAEWRGFRSPPRFSTFQLLNTKRLKHRLVLERRQQENKVRVIKVISTSILLRFGPIWKRRVRSHKSFKKDPGFYCYFAEAKRSTRTTEGPADWTAVFSLNCTVCVTADGPARVTYGLTVIIYSFYSTLMYRIIVYKYLNGCLFKTLHAFLIQLQWA